MKKLILAIAILVMFMIGIVGNAQAISIDETYMWNNETVLDFDSEVITEIPSSGAWIAPGLKVKSSHYKSSFDDATALNQNGAWNDMGVFLHGYAGGTLSFIFTDPVQAVGGFMNYVHSESYDYIRVTATDYTGNVLEQWTNTIDTPGELNAGEFFGIERDNADIFMFIVSGTHTGKVLDNFTFSADTSGIPSVPEPATMILLGTCLAGLGVIKRKFKK